MAQAASLVFSVKLHADGAPAPGSHCHVARSYRIADHGRACFCSAECGSPSHRVNY